MDAKLQDLLSELERIGMEHDAREAMHGKRMLNLEKDTARLLGMLVRASGARNILEIGTSNGYSTMWLCWASAAVGGKVISIERSAEKQAMARENLERAGYLDRVELRLGDATEICRKVEGPIDLVFFDADRTSAPGQLEVLLPKLARRVLLVADNALSHPEEIAGYLEAVEKLAEFEHVVVPVGKGLSAASRI